MDWHGIAIAGIWIGVGISALARRGEAAHVAFWAMWATMFVAMTIK